MKAKTYDGSIEDWKEIVAEALMLKSPDELQVQDRNILQIVANVSPERSLTIIIRRNVAGITVGRLRYEVN